MAAVKFADAGSCSTPLAIGDVLARPSVDGAVIDLTGVWEFDNLMQVQNGLDLNVVVIQGDYFVRYPIGGDPVSGILSGLNDDLAAINLTGVEGIGSPDPDAEVLVFQPHRMVLSLPPQATEGIVTVVLYLVIGGDIGTALISNTVSTKLVFDAGVSQS